MRELLFTRALRCRLIFLISNANPNDKPPLKSGYTQHFAQKFYLRSLSESRCSVNIFHVRRALPWPPPHKERRFIPRMNHRAFALGFP